MSKYLEVINQANKELDLDKYTFLSSYLDKYTFFTTQKSRFEFGILCVMAERSSPGEKQPSPPAPRP